MTIQEFIEKWGSTDNDMTLERFCIGLSACDASGEISQPAVVAEASVQWQRTPHICARRQLLLGGSSFDDVAPRVLDDLNKSLEDHISWIRRLEAKTIPSGKPVLVVLAGAGFSKGFGLPLTDELKEYALKRCSDPDPAANVDFPNTNEYPLSDFAKPKRRIPDIEYLLTIWLDYLNQLEQAGIRTASARHSYHAFLENICCHLYAKGRAAAGAAGGRVQAMVRWLKDAGQHYDVRFITFNYDLLLEAICRHAGREFVYLQRPSETVAVPIRKLHGSLNWRTFFRELPKHSAEIVQLYHDNEQHIYAMCDPDRFWPGEAGRAPFIIPPSASKEYEALLWQTWRFAIGDIEVADKVLIVGYSFPPLDAFATIQLRHALRPSTQAGKRPKTIYYVCPSANDCRRVSELLGLADQQVSTEPWDIEHFYDLLEAPMPVAHAD